MPLVNRTFGSLAHWLEPSFGTAFRLKPDLDRIEALSTERAALWARVDAASFLDRNEKRAALGYGEVDGVEAEITVSDMADEAGVEGDATLAVADAQAQIATLKARLYDLERRYDGQPRDENGKFSFGRGRQQIAQILIRICVASGISRFTDSHGNGSYNAEYQCSGGRSVIRSGQGRAPGLILDPYR